MPPHKIGNLSKATFANIEHQAIEYRTDCLSPWFTKWEQEAVDKLCQSGETNIYGNSTRTTFFAETCCPVPKPTASYF